MMRWLPWLVVAGCARPPANQPARDVEVAPAPTPVTSTPVVVQPARELPYARTALPIGPHTIAAVVNGAIAQLAVPPDGGYVVTLDSSGGVLLWPTLDGKREPVVVATRIGAQVATVRDGDAIAIAVVDKIGQLELVRLTRSGKQLSHDDIAVPRPIVQLVAAAGRFVALRDDQIVAAIDSNGALAGEVEVPAGERIAQLVARGDRVVGVTTARKGKHTARALEIAGALAWAAPSKRFTCDDQGLALSPDGKRLVGTSDGNKHVVAIDLARGTSTRLDLDLREIEGGERVLAVSDHGVMFVDQGTVYERADKDGDTEQVAAELWSGAVVTPARTIGGIGLGYLVVVEHGRTKYLGYRSGSLSDVIATSDGGWLATDGGGLFRLDAGLGFASTVKTPFERHEGWNAGVAIIDEQHAVIAEDSSYFLYKLGDDAGDLIAGEGGVEFLRATGLAILPDKTSPTLARWNAKRGKFDHAFDLPAGASSGLVRLFDPAATNGMVAMFVDDNEASDIPGKQKIGFHEIYANGAKLRERDRVQLVDNSDVFEGRSGPNLDALLPAAAVRATSADGTLIAELANARISLFDRDGNVRWARPAQGAIGVAWNGADQLIAFGAGIAHLDLETGDFNDQRCGWDFGLWPVAPQAQTAAGMCVLP